MPIVPNSASTSLSSLSNLYQKNLNSEADSFILSESGKRYAAALGRFLDEQNCLEVENNGNNDTVAYMEVWTSLLRRSIEMAEYLNPYIS